MLRSLFRVTFAMVLVAIAATYDGVVLQAWNSCAQEALACQQAGGISFTRYYCVYIDCAYDCELGPDGQVHYYDWCTDW